MLRNASRILLVALAALFVITCVPTLASAHTTTTTRTVTYNVQQISYSGRWITVTTRGRASTLWGIAAIVYGTGHKWPTIYAANQAKIKNPHWIYPGQRLWVPAWAGSPAPSSTKPSTTTSNRAAIVVAYALAQRGDPYRWGAAGPNAFDCSGLVMASYARIGIRLYHQSYAMAQYGRAVSRANLRPGDIVSPESGHVAIYVGGGKIVHAPHPGAYVRVEMLYNFNWARRLV